MAHRPGPALRRAADRAGWLPGRAQLLDRLRARAGRRDRPDRRAAARRRGVVLPATTCWSPATRSRCAARLAATSSGRQARAARCCWSAGGSGIVPLMAMIRHRAAAAFDVPARLLYSVRSPDEAIYFDELEMRRAQAGRAGGVLHLHPQPAPGLARLRPAHRSPDARRGRRPLGPDLLAYVCGPTPLVRAWRTHWRGLGIRPERIRTERFGPTGTSGTPG